MRRSARKPYSAAAISMCAYQEFSNAYREMLSRVIFNSKLFDFMKGKVQELNDEDR
jgi:pimeloyl-CoA synthetase